MEDRNKIINNNLLIVKNLVKKGKSAELVLDIALHNNALTICTWLRGKCYISDEIINCAFVRSVKKNNLSIVK